jgi:hypothetical protein
MSFRECEPVLLAMLRVCPATSFQPRIQME